MLHIVNFESNTYDHFRLPFESLLGLNDIVVLTNIDANNGHEIEHIHQQLKPKHCYSLNDKRPQAQKKQRPLTEINTAQFVELCAIHTPISTWY